MSLKSRIGYPYFELESFGAYGKILDFQNVVISSYLKYAIRSLKDDISRGK